MRRFSIKDLERFSGIKAHTIRVWENRHSLLIPGRTPGGIRTYSINEVKTLFFISLLVDNGFKISALAKLAPDALEAKTNMLLTEAGRMNKVIYSLILSMYLSDTDGFENLLNEAVRKYGVDTTIISIIIPFLEKTQLLSYKDTSAEAHFTVTAIRKKLITGIESIANAVKPKNSCLLFLPKGEHYDLMLLFITYLLKKRGDKILYLGTNITDDSLKNVLLDKKPSHIYTYLPSRYSYDPAELASFLKKTLPATSLLIAEEDYVTRKNIHSNVQFFHFKDALTLS